MANSTLAKGPHTPAPWTLGWRERIDRVKFFRTVEGAGKVLAFIPNGPDENDCNARLMIASPKLLEACRRVANTLRGSVGDGTAADFVDWAQALCREAMEAAQQ